MNTLFNPFQAHASRIGFHYFPDTLHYREADLQTWLPELTSLGAEWLLLKSPASRAIPESFLRGLVQSGIEPLVQFDLPLSAPPALAELTPILEVYSRWGVKAVLFFDSPNTRASWSAPTWAQHNLVEHFLDRYLPLAQAAAQVGLTSILPPLQPAGAYWDTAFLRAVLEGMTRRKNSTLLEGTLLSCYARANQRPLNWGSGGPERWPSARPYHTPEDSQDHNGFRIFDWYQSIARSILNHEVPIILLQAGAPFDPACSSQAFPPRHPQEIEAIARALIGEAATDPSGENTPMEPVPASVLVGFFYQLSAESTAPTANHTWFQPDGTTFPAVDTLRALAASPRQQVKSAAAPQADPCHPIQHYLLLPTFEWGVADWHLEMLRPLIKKYRPTIGFSVSEAALAQEVTVIGNASAYSEETLDQLRLSGSTVRRIDGIGIEFASQMAER